MKLILTNDWHFASKNPVSRTDDYNGELFGLLEQVLQLAAVLKPQAVLVAGDLFHDKNRAPWSVVIRLLEWGQRVRQYCPVLTIPGNHDLWHDRYESRGETPYGALIGSGIFDDASRQNYPDGFRIGVHGPTVYGVPWPDGGHPDAFRQVPSQATVVLAHGFADQLGEPQYGVHSHKYEDLARQAPWVKLWHFGHDHSDSGVYTCANGAKVVNIGALSRGALDRENLTRQVKVAVADLSGPPSVQQVALRAKSVQDIFDLALHDQKARESRQVSTFIAQLQSGLTGFDVDYQAALGQMPLERSVREKVQEYIARAESVV